MGRKRRSGRPINGWINVDKPVGVTSAACVNSVRHALDAAKLGHAGPLTPNDPQRLADARVLRCNPAHHEAGVVERPEIG